MADKILSITDGLHDELPSTTTAVAGRILITTDRGEMYYEPEDKKRIKINNADQAYDPTSENAQSGKAVSEAISEALMDYDHNFSEIKGLNVIRVQRGENGTHTSILKYISALSTDERILIFDNEIVIEVSDSIEYLNSIGFEVDSTYQIKISNGELEYIGKLKKGAPTIVDQTYSPDSENAQSGKAVAKAIASITMGDISTTKNQESALLGESLTLSLISSTGWTDNGDGSYKHTSGTDPLEFSVGENTGTKFYQISFEETTGLKTHFALQVTIGNSLPYDLYGLDSPFQAGIQSISNGNLKFIPNNAYSGTISNIIVKEITQNAERNYKLTVKDSNGNISLEIGTTKGNLNNIFIGKNSGKKNTSGFWNYSFGDYALSTNTSGFRNVAIGDRSLGNNSVGSRNIAIGHIALQSNTIGDRNTAIGGFALHSNIDGFYNIAIGEDCLNSNTSGHQNVSIGTVAMYGCTTGSYNTAVGESALGSLTTGSNNVAIGKSSGTGITTGSNNVALGYYSISANKEGEWNVAVGAQTLQNVVSGNRNVAIGGLALSGGTKSNAGYCTCIGFGAGQNIIGGQYNTCIGYLAGSNIVNGHYNVIIGEQVGADNPNGHRQLNIMNLIKGSMAVGLKYFYVDYEALPSTDPQIKGRLWNDNGTVKISSGAVA